MQLWLMMVGCGGVFFGGQQGEEFDGDSASVTDSGGADDTGGDSGTDLFLLEGLYSGTITVNADVFCAGAITVETDGHALSGSGNCGARDYTLGGTLGNPSFTRDDGSSWQLELSTPDDQRLLGSFEGKDAAGVETSGQLEALFDGD